LGILCQKKFKPPEKPQIPPPDAPVAAEDHRYVEGGVRPPPTTGDVTEVQTTIARNDNATWRFERTVYQNRHHGNHRRIIHLFVAVDENGVVKDVSDHSFVQLISY
jgi:hypothetical protein